MKPWLKACTYVLGALLLAAGWLVYFHNAAAAERLPKWHWLQATIAYLGERVAPEAAEDEDPDNTKNEIPVHTAHVSVATLHRYVEGFGTVVPRPPRRGQMSGGANVASPVAGVVSKVLAQVGQVLRAGEPVIQLDDRLAKSAEEQAAAALAQAQASLAALKATPRPDQLQIAELGVQKSRSAVELALKSYDRLKLLATQEGASAKSVEQAASDLAAARIDLTINQKQLAILESSPTPAELNQENAKAAQAAAALATAQMQRQLLTITAPIDATVASLSANPGEAVDTVRTLVQFVALDRLSVEISVPADQLPATTEGLAAELILSAAPKAGEARPEPVIGKVAFVSPQVDPRNGAVLVGIDLPPTATLRPGLTVRVRIIAEEHKDCLAVPRAAVVADENGDSVIAIVEGQQATHKTVQPGLEENGLIEVITGDLKEGATVVAAGAYGLPQATRVKVLD